MFIRILVAVLLSLLLPFPAFAYDCDSAVVDEAGWFSQTDIGRLEKAVAGLTSIGPTVLVRTIDDYGNVSGLDQYKADKQAECRAWRSEDGGMKNSLIIFVAEKTHRQVGIYFGDRWRTVLNDGVTKRVQNDFMTPSFRDGEFADGFIAGIEQIAKLVKVETEIKSKPSTTTIKIDEPIEVSLPKKESVQTLPAGTSFRQILTIVGFSVVFALLLVAMLLYRRKVAAHFAARSKAILAFNNLKGLLLKFDLEVLSKKTSEAMALFEQVDGEAIDQGHINLQNEVVAINKEAYDLGFSVDDDKLSESALVEFETALKALMTKAMSVDKKYREYLANLEKIIVEAREAPQNIDKAVRVVQDSLIEIESVAEKGFNVEEPRRVFSEAETLIEKAKRLITETPTYPASANKSAALAVTKAEEAARAATTIEKVSRDLNDRIVVLGVEIVKVKETIADRRKIYEQMEREYNSRSIASIRGNGTEAENRLVQVEDTTDRALELVSMTVQDWKSAEMEVTKAEGLMNEIDVLLESIVSLRSEIETAKANLATEIDAAQSDLSKAMDFVDRHENVVGENLSAELNTASISLIQVRNEALAEKPDYPELLRTALAVNATADAVFEKAFTAVEVYDRQRRQAQNQISLANGTVDQVVRYISLHRDDVGTIALSKLRSAEDYLRSARDSWTSEDFSAAIRSAESAANLAERALRQAKDDIDAEEEERLRRSTSNNSWGTSSTSRSRSTSSSSFGDSSDGGGESSSFGKSSSGGGTASGW